MERLRQQEVWKTVERPGYLGKARDAAYEVWNKVFGEGNWRIGNQMADGEMYSYEDVIYKVYVPGYEKHFSEYPDEAKFITDNYSYGYDKTLCTKEEAFDIYAFYNKPGIANQFHQVAFNLALINLGYKFKGDKPIQVREGKPGTPDSNQPDGFMWSPGRIMAVKPELTPEPIEFSSDQTVWWKQGSIEEQYQLSKVLQIKLGQ